MKLGILNDLHLGAPGRTGEWHNRLMFDQAEAIARSAIAVLNRQRPDAVVVLGDITQSGEPAQVGVAREVLASLAVPWYALPGNHDRAALKSGLFDEAFAGHVLPFYSRLGGSGVVCLRESLAGYGLDDDGFQLGQTQIAQVLDAVDADRPEHLIVLCHFPLMGEESWAAEHGGKDAGHLPDGPRLVEELSRRATRPVLILCGHQHWHHISHGRGWVQCVTASLIEYPMEVRLVTIDGQAVDVETFPGGAEQLASASLLSAAWVRGRDEDRAWRSTTGDSALGRT